MDTYTGGIPTTDEFVNILIHTLTSGPGLVAVVGFLLLMIAAAASKKARWLAFGALMYLSTYGFSWMPWFHHVLIPPLEIIKQQSRNLTIVLMLVVCFGACFSARGTRQKLLIGATIAIFAFELLYCTRLMLGGWFSKGGLGAVLYFMIFGTFALALPMMLQDVKDVHNAIRCVAIAGVLFCLGTAAQLVIDRGGVVLNGRLASTPGTATHTAEAIAIMLPCVVFLIFSREEPKALRALWVATAGTLIIFMIFTGTRNGVLMSFFALVLLFRMRLGKLVAAGVLVGIVAMIAWQFIGTDASSSASRLIDLTDTRTAGWRSTVQGFYANPAFGSLTSHQLLVENSYITIAADMGLFGLIPLAVAMVMVCVALFKLNRLRRLLGEDTMLADLVIGGFVSLAVGAVFEGYLLGMLNMQVYAIYFYLAILTFIFDRMRQASLEGQPPQEYDAGEPIAEPEPAYDMAGAGYN